MQGECSIFLFFISSIVYHTNLHLFFKDDILFLRNLWNFCNFTRTPEFAFKDLDFFICGIYLNTTFALHYIFSFWTFQFNFAVATFHVGGSFLEEISLLTSTVTKLPCSCSNISIYWAVWYCKLHLKNNCLLLYFQWIKFGFSSLSTNYWFFRLHYSVQSMIFSLFFPFQTLLFLLFYAFSFFVY